LKRVKISTLAASPNGVGKPLADSIAKVTAWIDDRRRAVGEDDQELEYVHQLIEAVHEVPPNVFLALSGFRIEIRYRVTCEILAVCELGVLHEEDAWGDDETWVSVVTDSTEVPIMVRTGEAWALLSWCERVTDAAAVMPCVSEAPF